MSLLHLHNGSTCDPSVVVTESNKTAAGGHSARVNQQAGKTSRGLLLAVRRGWVASKETDCEERRGQLGCLQGDRGWEQELEVGVVGVEGQDAQGQVAGRVGETPRRFAHASVVGLDEAEGRAAVAVGSVAVIALLTSRYESIPTDRSAAFMSCCAGVARFYSAGGGAPISIDNIAIIATLSPLHDAIPAGDSNADAITDTSTQTNALGAVIAEPLAAAP